eukprot:13187184-Ditylum_brightwellii.AAC.1
MSIVDMVGKYYRWFNVLSNPLKDTAVQELLDNDINQLTWIDAMKCQILLRKKALPELLVWIETINHKEGIYTPMDTLFGKLQEVTTNNDHLNEGDQSLLEFAEKHLFFDDIDEDQLPIPIYSSIKPSMGPEFILSMLLSLGRFSI